MKLANQPGLGLLTGVGYSSPGRDLRSHGFEMLGEMRCFIRSRAIMSYKEILLTGWTWSLVHTHLPVSLIIPAYNDYHLYPSLTTTEFCDFQNP